MTDYDVLIVGGGPAGSTLAWALRDSGLRIAILDKQDFPRDKVCAGWVTPAVIQELQIDLNDYGSTRVLQAVHGFRVSHSGGKEVDTRLQTEPVSYSIRRFEFDHYLLQRCGAEFIPNIKFAGIDFDGKYWTINDQYRTRLLVGAGGHFCPVARAIGAGQSPSEKIVAAKEIEFKMTPEQQARCPIKGEVPELIFSDDLEGYGWIVRKGDYLNIGLGREDKHKLSEHVAAFVQQLKDQGKIPLDTPENFHGHAYLLYPHAGREVVKDGVLLIGDAAGLAYPQSGEGIRPAIETALMAARVIKQANGNYSASNLQNYYQQMVQRFGKRQPVPNLLERLPRSLKQFIARRLLANRWFVQNVVMERWFLHQQQAPLLRE